MKPKEYVKNVLVTEAKDLSPVQARMSTIRNVRLMHGAIGLASELAEVVEMQQIGTIDEVNLKEEMGDIYWYMGIMVDELGLDPDEVYSAKPQDLTHYSARDMMLSSATDDLAISIGTAIDLLKKSLIYGKELDVNKLKQNLMDIGSHTQFMLNLYGFTSEQARERNIEKLRARYGDKFTEAAALERNLAVERKILEEK